MANLEHDLIHSQEKIVALLNEYQKASEEIIKSNYTNQLYNLLDCIASFDHSRIRQCETFFKDEATVKFIHSISQSIKSREEAKANSEDKKVSKVEEKKKVEPAKRQSRIIEKTEEKKKGGFLDYVRNKLTSKEKKATQMILPDEEPKCYYDLATKSWIFQGQQPQVPKTISKPPSAAEKKSKEEVKKVAGDDSQLGQLTAPPAFKRKNTPGGAAGKGKAKIKQEVEVLNISQTLTFAKVIESINSTYINLLQKARCGVYERRPQVPAQSPQVIAQFMSFAERTLQISEQISQQQNKVIDKWGKILTSETREFKIMQKIIKQISQSASTYTQILQKLDDHAISKSQKNIKEEVSIDQFEKSKYETEIREKKKQIKEIQSTIHSLKKVNNDLNASNINLVQEKNSILHRLEQGEEQLRILGQKLRLKELTQLQLKSAHNQLIENHAQEINQLKDKYKNDILNINAKIEQLQDENNELHLQNNRLEQALSIQRAKINNSMDKVNAEITKQKIKIQSQLKFYEEKEKIYLTSLKHLQEHENIIQEYQSALCQENQLLNSILEKRLQLNKNPENEDYYLANKHHDESTSHSIILELSDIVSSITETHLDRLENFSRNYSKLHKKYKESKEMLNKIKNNAVNENMSLNRSVTRLKGLLQTYKNGKDEAQERCSQLELECDKLKKKLHHYKEEDQFNKSYLSKLKTSNIHSQNQSVLSLQGDKEELVSEIEELQRELQQMNETLKKYQNDLEDLLNNQQKHQARLLEVEKKYKQSEKEIRIIKQSLEQETNKNKLLQLKLQNQKERCEQIQNREESRLKSAQSNLEKKIKLLRYELDQSNTRQQHLKCQIEELHENYNARVAGIQQNSSNIEKELRDSIIQKQNEISEVLLLLDETNQKLQSQSQEKQRLQSKNKQMFEKEKQLNAKIGQIIDEHIKQIAIHQQSQENMKRLIETLIQRYDFFKSQSQSFKSEYNSKIEQLQHELSASNNQSLELFAQINSYSKLISQLSHKVQLIKDTQLQDKQKNNNEIQLVLKENEQLQELAASLKEEMQEKIKENRQFQEIIEKMSQDMARLTSNTEQLSKDKTDLQQKLMFKERQLQTLYNQNNTKSEELMIKIQEVLEKDRLMLERQEQSVMNKEEFDELKNQILKLSLEVKEKEQRIKELEIDLELLASELEEDRSNAEETAVTQSFVKQSNELKNALELKDKEISSFGEYIQALNFQLSGKNNEIERLKQQNDHGKKEIEELNIAIIAFSSNLEQSLGKTINANNQLSIKQTFISELQVKLAEKDVELSFLLEKLQAAENQIRKQIDETDEVQTEIHELLQQIQIKENQLKQIHQLMKLKENEFQLFKEEVSGKIIVKQSIIQQFQEKMVSANQRYNNLQAEKAEIQDKYQSSIEAYKHLQSKSNTLESRISQLEKQALELMQLNQILEKQVQNAKEILQKEEELSQSQAKQEGKVIEDLVADIRSKDQILSEKNKEVEKKDEIILQLYHEKELKQTQIREMKKIVAEKSKLVTEAQIAQQQKIRIIIDLQKNIKEQEEKVNDLERNLTEMAEIMENQESAIESLKNEAQKTSSNETKELKASLDEKSSEIIDLKKKIQDITKRVTQKQGEYEMKIENLERQIIGYSSLKNANKKFEQTLKALEEENKMLTSEKVELMKSNNYLVSINQKLISDKSPHNQKESKEAHKTQSQVFPQINQKAQSRQSSASQVKVESKGFLGALSSLFLTPTETDRLRK